ncbi:TIGR01777 family oxidoreductase [Pontibacter silvestris]|uniref:TIGR01777 family oxidoreductase n=1 Tax=Pontibacter silvestris TaxID=2305183 RepID=A0ABW4X420_9BACT|nr:TIGR01777 family oxidoreductase [Pontibacter silvestris]MCC9137922.1 TIGR01777 family oxidoreductase [Pontibacter silvestris]
MPGKILITGGSGLIGMRLSEMLIDQGYEVGHLSRNPEKVSVYKTFKWDVEEGYIDDSAITYADYIVHLAGASVAGSKWTEERKHEIFKSRVDSTNLLYKSLRNIPHHVKGFISSSAVGIYGNSGDRLMSEESNYADDFLASVCKVWESTAWQVKELGLRTAIFRLGIVLSDKGGALPQIAKPIKMMAGAALGSGKQYMSWVHIDDVCRLFIKAIEDTQFEGVYNAVAPHPVTNEQLTKTLAEVMHKPLLLPNVPAFAINLMMGEMSKVVLASQRVSANKVLQTGFTFEYNYLNEALETFYKSPKD